MSNPDESHQDTRINRYGRGILGELASICAGQFGRGPYVIISDERIWAAVSPRMRAFLSKFPDTRIFLLKADPPPYASDSLVAEVGALLEKSQALPIAVGAGTINDLVKRSSFELGRRYISVPTAPSVDGFTAYGAAIFEELFSADSAAGRSLGAGGFAPEGRLLERRLEFCASALGGSPFRSKTEEVIHRKTPDPVAVALRAARARAGWDGMRRAIKEQLPPFETVKEALRRAGCPTEPEDIGLGKSACGSSIKLASTIRSRYTVLDLASELGVLDLCAEGALSARYFSRFVPP